MRRELILEGQVARHSLLGIADGLVGTEIDSFIVEAPPQPFDEDIIPPQPHPIHSDLNSVVFQEPGEFLARELTALTRC